MLKVKTMANKETGYVAPVAELIEKRVSWRNYLNRPVEQEKIALIEEYISSLEPPPFGSDIRFKIVHDSLDGKKNVAGSYGLIKRAETFIAGAVVKKEKNMEDFGYLFEKIILFATELGLSTCWMGGTFNRTSFGEKIQVKADEVVPIVSPLGYPAKRRAVFDAIMYTIVKAKDRKPWNNLFFKENMSVPAESSEYTFPLEMLRLAPSSCNRQPWRIVEKNGNFHFFLFREEWYKKVFEVDLQKIDMGIAMCHFELAAKEKGLAGRWVIMDADVSDLPVMHEYIVSWEKM